MAEESESSTDCTAQLLTYAPDTKYYIACEV